LYNFFTMKFPKVKKAVIAAAGMGARFLPATKAMPKEMLPIIDKPVIQYIVEECVRAGIEDIIIVTGWHKRTIEDHFDYPFELEKRLREAGKDKEAEEVRAIAELANFIYVRQKGPYGNGTPILNAESVVGDAPFVALWSDELITSPVPRLESMFELWQETGKANMSCLRIEDPVKLAKYGVCDIEPESLPGKPNVFKLKRLVEKPAPGTAPSNLAALGSYVLPPTIFKHLRETPTGKNDELWLVDAITRMMKEDEVYAVEIVNGTYHDSGSKLGYLQTVVEFALKHPEVKDEFRKFLKNLDV